MDHEHAAPHDPLAAIDKERRQIMYRTGLGLLVLTVLCFIFQPPERALVIMAIVVVPPLISALYKYHRLGQQRLSLTEGAES